MTRGNSVPPGYTRFAAAGADVVAVDPLVDTIRVALAARSLYAYAAAHPERRTLRGRAIAYAVPLPDARTRVVVRHSRHGGLFAPITRDLFLPPTRAPRELANALRLAASGVPTPELIAYATYPAAGFYRRADVATRELEASRDLAAVLAPSHEASADDRARSATLAATARLLLALERAGARHPDLNLKNVLITSHAAGVRAAVIDVDRVVFGQPGDRMLGKANLARLVRSARKLRSRGAASITEAELTQLARAAGHGST